MQIQVNSNSSVAVHEGLTRFVQANVTHALKRFVDRITRVEVHLSDVNGDKSGAPDKRCLMEARPAGCDPVTVADLGGSLEEAIRGAAQKMKRRLSARFRARGKHRLT